MKNLLKQLGLNKKESEVYLRLLELGAQPVSIIAKHSSVPRSSMYIVIEKLKESGLVEEFQRIGIKYVKCIPVDDIHVILDQKEQSIENTKKLLNSRLLELKNLENRLSITPKTKIYEGRNEVRKIYEQVLKEKSFQAFFNPKTVKKHMPEYHYKIPETIKKNKGKAQEILIYSPEATEYKKLFNSKNHQIKILPKEATFDSDTIITDEKVFMILYDDQDISALEIWSKALAETKKTAFQYMWDSL
jgi:sugar-specific transcriptional regulator TrmB